MEVLDVFPPHEQYEERVAEDGAIAVLPEEPRHPGRRRDPGMHDDVRGIAAFEKDRQVAVRPASGLARDQGHGAGSRRLGTSVDV
ncbi:MAG: hypothetical protein ACQGVK_25860 [Myxococcota bacterium]